MCGFSGVELSLKPVVNRATDLLAGNGDNVIYCFVIVISLTVLLKLWVDGIFSWSSLLYNHVIGMDKVNLQICLLQKKKKKKTLH